MRPMTLGPPPGRLSRLLAMPATLIAGLAAMGWLDAFHGTVAAASLLAAALIALRRRHEQTSPSRSRAKLDRGPDLRPATPNRDLQRGGLYSCVTGVIRGALLLSLVAAASLITSLIPGLQAIVLDRDRTAVELKLDALEQAHDWAAAADLIALRLERRTSRDWHDALQARRYQSLIQAGVALSGEQARSLFQQAFDLAEENGVNNDSAVAHLERLKLQGALDRHEAAAKGLEEQRGQQHAELTRVSREMDQLQQRLTAAQTQADELHGQFQQVKAEKADNETKAIRAQIDMLLGWGDSIETDFAQRKRKYLTALALAQEHGLDSTLPASRLSQLEQIIKSREPVPLPVGIRVEIVGVSAAVYPPVVLLDLRVVTPNGDAVLGLATKDFQVTDGGLSQPVLAANQISPSPASIQLVLLFDCSSSTAGLAHQEAKVGALNLATGLQGTAVVKLIAFNATVTPVTDWTANPDDVAAGLKRLVANGNTALRKALSQAAEELAGRDGPKAVVLYTDGKDTVGGPDPQELVARYKQSGITIHVVALQTNDLDQGLLSTLASNTGGTIRTASQSSELTTRFRELARSLSSSFYRPLAFIPKNPGERLQVQVGGQNAVRVDCPLADFPSGSLRSLPPSDKKETSR